ncbi:hypothetical protein HBHAL_1458 [Halobacillus halophilus DSM 2266]|uniref:Uncharacterized protein n=1 Tax=Halobacillus halophilus (strain ATCC 35676 / DSM 2266 / JCM 20832 / KCTC 3685 / LMG 17431 / NBRC 102448 / NCIMB 2269) TaxID=866895 RepID=I0JI62_HALH3|nr:hypothetical protein HBHAL_1458 [Halobacillus halophilus DSM 2266]
MNIVLLKGEMVSEEENKNHNYPSKNVARQRCPGRH